jgi:hypothetical protein
MLGKSHAVIAGALVLGCLAGSAEAAPAAALEPEAQSLITPVHYRCVVRRCGPYRCVWVNRCRRPWWW